MNEEKIALVSVLGMSPAVVTETIWGLYREKPKLLPDEVKVYTTRKAWENMQRLLLTAQPGGGSIWEEMEQKVGKTIKLKKHIFEDNKGGELSDIVTSEDQDLVADQLLRGIREYKNPEQDNWRLVASIAGGRKSMSALMYGAMSLGAGADDLLTHVLADDRASSCSEFFFPAQEKQELQDRGGHSFRAQDVLIDLASIPFVPLATLVKNSDFKTGGSYSALVARARETVAKIGQEDTTIRVSKSKCSVYINGEELQLEIRPYVLMGILVKHKMLENKENKNLALTAEKAYKHLKELMNGNTIPIHVSQKHSTQEFFSPNSWMEMERKKDGTRVAKKDENGNKVYRFPDSISKEKTFLKKALCAKGFSDVADDAIGRGRLGFIRIKKTSFCD